MNETIELSGPALAEAVAVKVMGWSRYDSAFANINPPAYRRLVTEYTPGKGVDEEVYRVADFRPDLNIAQAWEVVEHVAKDLCFQIDNVGFTGEKYRVMIGWSDDPIRVIAEADTAPLAICRAALLAAAALAATEGKP